MGTLNDKANPNKNLLNNKSTEVTGKYLTKPIRVVQNYLFKI
jgi:hypothetical protein